MTTPLLPCPSCGFEHPAFMRIQRMRKDLDTKEWKDASSYTVKCPMCLMQAGPIELDSVWPVECWNKRTVKP